jgi:hypothetical protein
MQFGSPAGHAVAVYARRAYSQEIAGRAFVQRESFHHRDERRRAKGEEDRLPIRSSVATRPMILKIAGELILRQFFDFATLRSE